MKKCSICKMPIPPKVKTCPVCGHEFTRFEYFRINWLSKTIFAVIAAIIVYNLVVIMVFNRGIQKYKTNAADNPEALETMNQKYDKLNFFQKKFVRYSEIENFNEMSSVRQATEADESITVGVYTEKGSVEGSYKGEFVKNNIPDGMGEIVYTDKDGVEYNYEGQFSEGKILGVGIMSISGGDTFMGNFIDGQLNGYGKRYNSDGALVERGMYVNNKLDGKGTRFGNDGNPEYTGEFVYGIPAKTGYIPICKNVEYDELVNNSREHINENIALTGMITDINTIEGVGQYYIFSPNGDDENRFKVFYKGEKMRFVLWENYTVYGYCENKEEISDSHNKKTNGLVVKSYYIEKN